MDEANRSQVRRAIMIQATTSPTETRLCNGGCGRELPLTEFRRRRKGSDERHSICSDCRNLKDVMRRQTTQRREMGKDLTALQREMDINRVAALVAAMLRKYGGFDAFVKKWAEHIEYCQGRKHLQSFATKSFLAISHLIVVCDQNRDA